MIAERAEKLGSLEPSPGATFRLGGFAWGFGGQYILVFRELDLVVAAPYRLLANLPSLN